MLRIDELHVADRLFQKHVVQSGRDRRLFRYYDGSNRLQNLGISIPPELDSLEVVVGWPTVVVEAINERSDVKTIRRVGELEADRGLLEQFDANNLDSQIEMFNRDKLVYGRAFLSVGANEDDPEHPLIMVESPREISVEVDRRQRRITSALKVVREDDSVGAGQAVSATLYLPDSTVWLSNDRGQWRVVDRDDHGLGRVSLVMSLNRQMTGMWSGKSEMEKVIPVTDAAIRTLTDMQFAVEAAAIPRKYVVGASTNDFVDGSGSPLPQWEAYIGSVWALENEGAKIGQLPGADLKAFHDTVDLYGRLASSLTGFPPAYFGQHTSNPPAEGAIRAEESRLVKTVERSNRESGKALAWALDLSERYRTGGWPEGNRVKVEWHDPGTPTFAQRADALTKMAGGTPVLSREGAWDELGWDQARMERERERFDRQEAIFTGFVDADVMGDG